jgi:hypothetical protein
MDEARITRPSPPSTRTIVADEGFCRQVAALLLCEPVPIRDAFIGEPAEEVLEMARWVLSHEDNEGFDAAGVLTSWARKRGRGAWSDRPRRPENSRLSWSVPRPARTGGPSMVAQKPELHHAAPRCLLTLHERANGTTNLDGAAIQAWVEWEWEAMRWRVPVEISRAELEELVERSAELLERERHRLLHEGDWRRWGARGGRETFRRYGADWFSLLALRRWGRITASELEAARVIR